MHVSHFISRNEALALVIVTRPWRLVTYDNQSIALLEVFLISGNSFTNFMVHLTPTKRQHYKCSLNAKGPSICMLCKTPDLNHEGWSWKLELWGSQNWGGGGLN